MLVVIVYVQIEGFRAHGLGYLKHFIGEPFNPKGLYYVMVPLNLLIHLIGEFVAKPLSLTIRLFGNIFGEDTVISELTKLAVRIQHAIFIPIPIQLVMVLFAIFGGFIQAFIFTLLSGVYISLALGDEHAEEHEKGEKQATEPAAVQ
jgi:F-type H+-transporting ATPase subunit a